MIYSRVIKLFVPACILLTSHILSAQSQPVRIEQDSLITKLMTVKKQIDIDTYTSQFFTIQLYYGNNQEAERILEEFKVAFPKWEAELSFETPNYKVQVGKFKEYYFGLNKLKEIKRVYPAAFLLKIKN